MLSCKFLLPFALLLFVVDTQTGSVTDQIADSGRCMLIGETPDARTSPVQLIAPGPPPLLSFRTYEGKQRGRFGNTDLMLDDAGH